MPDIVSLKVSVISVFQEVVNLKVDRVKADGSIEEIFMDPVKIGDEIILEGISLTDK